MAAGAAIVACVKRQKKLNPFPLRLEPEDYRALKALAKEQDRSAAWLARKFIREGIERSQQR